MLLFFLGVMAGGLIGMIIMAMLFVSAREEQRSDLLLRAVNSCGESKSRTAS